MAFNFQSQDGSERFDSRMLFHDRRHFLHTEIIKWSQLSVKDTKYMGEWCAALMALHRTMWGTFDRVIVTLERHPVNIKLRFNEYMEIKLKIIHRNIMRSFKYYERPDGNVYVKANRDELKKYYYSLDKAQKEIAMVEYSKNMDLPPKKTFIEEATDGTG